jgi:hypothetical protein
MSIDHDKFKPPTCIPVRSKDIGFSGDTPYYIGVRPKELAVYPWPLVIVNTREEPSTCEQAHAELTYMQAIYGYEIKNSTFIVNCYRDPADDEDTEDEIPPEGTCERLTDYGGAQVKQGWLQASITNWVPETPDEDEDADEESVTMPIPLQLRVRKQNHWKLATEEDELGFITIIEVGLLEGIQVHVNSTLAKCNIYGYNLVYVENSALHESIIESDGMIHLDNMCQVKSDLSAPYVLIDYFAMLEGDGNTIEADKYLYLNHCTNFGAIVTKKDGQTTTTIGSANFAGNQFAYGISDVEVPSTPCIKVSFCTLLKTNLSSPQMGVRGSTMHDCSLTFAKTSDKDDDLRNPSELEYTYEVEIEGKDEEGETITETQTRSAVLPSDKLREGILVPPWSDKYFPRTIKELLFASSPAGDYVIGCITEPNRIGLTSNGRTINSMTRMYQFFPYATDINNRGFNENRQLVYDPITQTYTRRPTNPKLPYHSLTLSHLSSCQIEAEKGNFYSSANEFTDSSVVADILNIEGIDAYLGNSSLECNVLRGWTDGDNIVNFGGSSTATIGEAKSIKLIAKFGSELTLEQEYINYGSFAVVQSFPGANVTLVASTCYVGDVEGPHRGNYKFQFLAPYPSVIFGDTSAVTAEAIGLSPGNAASSSFGPAANISNQGQMTVGNIIGANFTNNGILSAGEILGLDYSRLHSNIGKLTNAGGSIVKVQDIKNKDSFESEDTPGGIINASSIELFSVSNLTGGVITAGSIIATRLTCNPGATLRVVSILVPDGSSQRAILLGTIEGCSDLTIGDTFTSEEAKFNSGSSSNRNVLAGTVSIGNLIARDTSISDITQGSTISTALLSRCSCNVNWRSMGTTPEFFFSTNFLFVDNAKFFYSNQLGSHITNCTFLGGVCIVQCAFSRALTFEDMNGKVEIRAVGGGSHRVSISKSSLSFTCGLDKIEEDIDGDGFADIENFLTVTIEDSNVDLQTGVISTNIGGNLNVSNAYISNGIMGTENCNLIKSSFYVVDVLAIDDFSATDCHFEGGQIGAGGNMIDCTYKGMTSGPGSGANSSLAGITFKSSRFTRAYPNVGIVETINFTRTFEEQGLYPPTYEPYNPSFGPPIQPQYQRTSKLPDIGGPYTRSYVFEVENALIYGPSLYEGVGLRNITIDMEATTFFEEDEEGNLVAVHSFSDKLEFVNCHIDNVTILNGNNIIFTNCMIENYVNKGAIGVTFMSCGLIGSSFQGVLSSQSDTVPGTEIVQCELFGVFASQGLDTIVTSSVDESSDDSAYLKLDNGTINLNSIIFDKGAGFDSFTEEEKLKSISDKSDIEGRVDIINSSNSGLIYAKDISMKNSTNLAVGDICASHFEWLGGNTNIGFITCSTFSGIIDNNEGVGDLARHFNTRDGGETLVINSIGNVEPKSFIYDYGPYYVFSNGATTLNPNGSQIQSESPLIEMDFNISSIGTCLPATINVTESNEYYFNGARASTHGWHFHERRQYHFINNTNHPIGFVSPLPPGFSYTGSFLDSVRDGNRYYTGTITVMVGRPFVGTVTFESLRSSIYPSYSARLSWEECPGDTASGSSGDDGQQTDPETPPVPDGHPPSLSPPDPPPPEGENPVIPILGPGGVRGPHGTLAMASYNRAFGIRIFYATELKTRQDDNGYAISVPDTLFVEGIPFEGTNTRKPRSFNNYVFDQIIYPDILETYFEEKATQLNLPRIYSTSQKYGFR